MNLRELDLEAQVSAACTAKELFDQIRPYFDKLREDYLQSFVGSPVGDVDSIMIIKFKLDVLDNLQGDFEKIIFAGKIASKELEGELNG